MNKLIFKEQIILQLNEIGKFGNFLNRAKTLGSNAASNIERGIKQAEDDNLVSHGIDKLKDITSPKYTDDLIKQGREKIDNITSKAQSYGNQAKDKLDDVLTNRRSNVIDDDSIISQVEKKLNLDKDEYPSKDIKDFFHKKPEGWDEYPSKDIKDFFHKKPEGWDTAPNWYKNQYKKNPNSTDEDFKNAFKNASIGDKIKTFKPLAAPLAGTAAAGTVAIGTLGYLANAFNNFTKNEQRDLNNKYLEYMERRQELLKLNNGKLSIADELELSEMEDNIEKTAEEYKNNYSTRLKNSRDNVISGLPWNKRD